MPLNIPRREHWEGHPIELGAAWTLRKGENEARCSLWSHPLGWELRLFTTDLLRSQVCRTSDEIIELQEQWKAAMLDKGWL